MCSMAVSNCGEALKYVREQTEEICLEAIRNEPLAIEFVKK